jgi:heme-degrading monooxygenase HmoA
MAKLIINHKTDDFNKWKVAFDALDPARKKYGNSGAVVYRGHADPNDLVIISQWGSADQAKAWSQSPELREGMKNGGVVGESKAYFVD